VSHGIHVPSCSKKPWRRWRSSLPAFTSTRPSAAAATRRRFFRVSRRQDTVAIDRDPDAEAAAARAAPIPDSFPPRLVSELPDVLADLRLRRSMACCSISESPRRRSTTRSAAFLFATTVPSTCGWTV
jgi:hypothetical protein